MRELSKVITARIIKPEELLYWEQLMFLVAIKARIGPKDLGVDYGK